MKIFFRAAVIAVLAALVSVSCAAPADSPSQLQSRINVTALDSATQIAKDAPGVTYDLTAGDPLPGTYTFTQTEGEGLLTCAGQTFKLWVENRSLKIARPTGQINGGKEIYEVSIPTEDGLDTACYFQVSRKAGTEHYLLVVYK